MVFVGYEAGTKAYRFYNPVSRRVHVSRDAVFEEERSWEWGAEKGAGPDDDIEPFVVEHLATGPTGQGGPVAATPTATQRSTSAPAPMAPPATPSQSRNAHTRGGASYTGFSLFTGNRVRLSAAGGPRSGQRPRRRCTSPLPHRRQPSRGILASGSCRTGSDRGAHDGDRGRTSNG